MTRSLLVVTHSRSGSTARLRDALLEGAAEGGQDAVVVRSLGPLDARPDDVLAADAIVIATPTNFGWMAGLTKDFFERIWHPCVDVSAGKPFALVVKGSTDADGGLASVQKIVTGLQWRQVAEPLVVVGDLEQDHLDAAWELGATVAAGLAESMW